MRKITILFLFPIFCAAQNLEQINKATGNAIELIKVFKKTKDVQSFDSTAKPAKKIETREFCSEFCVSNKNKNDAKILIKSKLASDSIEILTISGGESCYFDIPLGVYQIDIYFNNQLKIKTHFRVKDSIRESYIIPD